MDPVLLSGGTLLRSVHDPALKSRNVANQPRSLNLEKNFGESDQNTLLASQPEKCQDSCDHGGVSRVRALPRYTRTQGAVSEYSVKRLREDPGMKADVRLCSLRGAFLQWFPLVT